MAIRQLEKSREFLRSDMAKNKDLYEQFRAASIKAFEYTYELAIKTIHLELSQIIQNPKKLKEITFMASIEMAYQSGLVREISPFKTYREKRSAAIHSYYPDKAEKILDILGSFLLDCHYILERKKGSLSNEPA